MALNVTFNYIDKIFINGYVVKMYESESDIFVEEKYIDFNENRVLEHTETYSHIEGMKITLNNKPFIVDGYMPKVYLNDNLINSELYYIYNEDIVFSYKLNININDTIIVKYYSRIYNVSFDVDDNLNYFFSVIPIIEKNNYIGKHTIFHSK